MFNNPITKVLLLAGFSFVGAAFFWLVGGTVAEVTGKTGILGLTFKAGGGLAGFLIVFFSLFIAFERLAGRSKFLMVSLIGSPVNFVKAGNTYNGTYMILRPQSQTKHEYHFEARWQAGSLTVDIPNVAQEDLIKIVVSNQHGDSWESEYFPAFSPRIELIKV